MFVKLNHCSCRYIPGLAELWHAESLPWHAAFTAVPIFFIYFVRPASLYCKECVSVYTHISDCVQTVYELPLLPNNSAVKYFYTYWERFEELTGYLSLGRRSGGDWANT